MTNIVGLRGDPVPSAGEVQTKVVERLDELLTDARAGRLQGLGTVEFRTDHKAAWSHAGLWGSFSQVGAAYALLTELREAAKARE